MRDYIYINRVFESTLDEEDRVSFEKPTLEEGTVGVWGRQPPHYA